MPEDRALFQAQDRANRARKPRSEPCSRQSITSGLTSGTSSAKRPRPPRPQRDVVRDNCRTHAQEGSQMPCLCSLRVSKTARGFVAQELRPSKACRLLLPEDLRRPRMAADSASTQAKVSVVANGNNTSSTWPRKKPSTDDGRSDPRSFSLPSAVFNAPSDISPPATANDEAISFLT